MPVNWEQLHSSLRDMGRSLEAHAAAVRDAEAAVLLFLQKYAADAHAAERVASVVSRFDADLRCALPAGERLDGGQAPITAERPGTIIAAVGSQVTPDRHDAVLFGLVNIGTVVMGMSSGEAPKISTDTEMLYGENLYQQNGLRMSEGDIALRRDRRERANLLSLARKISMPSIALTDGPLELWGAKDVSDPHAFEEALRDYLADLRQMQRMGCAMAGYVDKPGADLVIRLFEVLEAGSDDLKRLRAFHPLRGASDRWLFSQILRPGHRSAVFGLQSSSRSRYTGDLSLHFFYLNVGTNGHPAIARVEIPKWVAESANLLGALHAVLLEQCSLLGLRPYPYILHRAHETARISLDEKEEIKLRLMLDLRAGGIELEEPSGKSTAKMSSDLKGRY